MRTLFSEPIRHALLALDSACGNTPLYWVGGLVRDGLLGLPLMGDIDLVIEANALEILPNVVETLPDWEIIDTYPPFGTLKIRWQDQSKPDSVEMDVASTRTESYSHWGALPTITALGVPLEADLQRRDFRINAMAIRLRDDVLIDPLGGQADLQAKRIDPLHDHSFLDDPTRIMRAVLYACRLGFTWSASCKQQVKKAINQLSTGYAGGGDRMRHEWASFLALPETVEKRQWLEIIGEMGLYRLIDTQLPFAFPAAFSWPIPLALLQERLGNMNHTLALAEIWFLILALSLPDAECVCERLGLSKTFRTALHQVQQQPILATLETLSHQPWTPKIGDWQPLAVFIQCLFMDNKGELWQRYQTALTEQNRFPRLVTGEDLLAAGWQAGPSIQTALDQIQLLAITHQLTGKTEQLDMFLKAPTPHG